MVTIAVMPLCVDGDGNELFCLTGRTLTNIAKDSDNGIFLIVREDTQEELDTVLNQARGWSEASDFKTVVVCVYGSDELASSFYSKLEPHLMKLRYYDLYMDDPEDIEVTHLIGVEDLLIGALITSSLSDESKN